MKSEAFDAALTRCIHQINELPEEQRGRLLHLVGQARGRQQAVDRSLREALDAIDDWRLHQKYMLFDMEARQRELNQQANDDAEADFGDDVDWI